MPNMPEIPPDNGENPFENMGIIRFWAVSSLFYLTFPISLLFSYVACGEQRTQQLIRALLNDFLQTILIAILVLVMLIWAAVHYLSSVLAWLTGF